MGAVAGRSASEAKLGAGDLAPPAQQFFGMLAPIVAACCGQVSICKAGRGLHQQAFSA